MKSEAKEISTVLVEDNQAWIFCNGTVTEAVFFAGDSPKEEMEKEGYMLAIEKYPNLDTRELDTLKDSTPWVRVPTMFCKACGNLILPEDGEDYLQKECSSCRAFHCK